MSRLGEGDEVLANVAFDLFQPGPRAIEMRMGVGADLVTARAQFSERRRVEHLTHHRAAQTHL